MNLLPVPASDRPAVVEQDGIKTFVYIHDQAYMQAKHSWKRRLAEAHPDRSVTNLDPRLKRKREPVTGRILPTPSSHGRFLQVSKQFRAWYKEERVYYWRLGKMMPPDWTGPIKPPPGWNIERLLIGG